MMQANAGPKVLSVADRSARSIFVGNISYDVTEEQLKQVFAQIGQVIHFRLVLDRETGKPKGFGFCEFVDVQTAENAQKTLNGFELNGRQLRVDSATGGERSADEVQQFHLALAGHQEESPYGPEPEKGKAPEVIARTVASMPPERMFELMRQMKETVLTNPMMAKQLLSDNPQLAYALLQAQVVMRVVDPKVAYSMLHREQLAMLTPFHQQVAGNATVQQPSSTSIPFNAAQTQQPLLTSNNSQQIAQPSQFQRSSTFGVPPPHMPSTHFSNSQQPQQNSIQHMQHASSHQQATIQQQSQQAAQLQNNAASEADEAHQAQMLVKVLQLTDEQIRMLPPEDRAKVIELRNQLRGQIAT